MRIHYLSPSLAWVRQRGGSDHRRCLLAVEGGVVRNAHARHALDIIWALDSPLEDSEPPPPYADAWLDVVLRRINMQHAGDVTRIHVDLCMLAELGMDAEATLTAFVLPILHAALQALDHPSTYVINLRCLFMEPGHSPWQPVQQPADDAWFNRFLPHGLSLRSPEL